MQVSRVLPSRDCQRRQPRGTLVSYMKAIEAGCDIVDTALSSMSLGPGQNPTESQLYCAAIQG